MSHYNPFFGKFWKKFKKVSESIKFCARAQKSREIIDKMLEADEDELYTFLGKSLEAEELVDMSPFKLGYFDPVASKVYEMMADSRARDSLSTRLSFSLIGWTACPPSYYSDGPQSHRDNLQIILL